MTKKVPKKILRIERHFFVNLRKKLFLAAHAAPRRRRRRFFCTGGAPPPPTEIDRRAAADTMTSAHSSSHNHRNFTSLVMRTNNFLVISKKTVSHSYKNFDDFF